MTHKKGQLPPQTDDAVSYRTLSVRAQSEADTASGAIPVILATEAPVKVYDRTLRKVVDEILLMSGCEVPSQVPMTDDHNSSSRSIIGSVRQMETKGDELHGKSYFSSKRSAQEMKQDVLDGHITDMSVGAQRIQEILIDSGKEETVAGRRFKGPARIVTRWKPVHGAVVGQGADGRSVFTPSMRAYREPDALYEEAMNETMRSHLESIGMPKELTDEAALDWMKANTARKATEPKADPPAAAPPGLDESQRQKVADDAARSERQRVKDIRTSVRAANMDDTFADGLIERGITKGEAAEAILAELSKRNGAHGVGIEHVGSERESFRKAALDSMSLRIGWQPPKEHKTAPGAGELRSLRFLDLAKRSLEIEGVATRSMDERSMTARAFVLGMSERASDGQAYLSTGNFANLLLDATNKTLLQAYVEAESTYQRWVRIAPSVPDFKTIYRTRLSELGYLPMVPENDDYKDLALSDSKESYRIEKHGALVSLTWEAMKNDDLSSFNRIVGLQGAAARRTINKAVYQLLFDNPTMSDTGALFNSTALTTAGGHNNLVASDASVATYNTMFTNFALKKGLNSDVILGLRPRYIITAAGELASHWQVMNSVADPAAGGSAAGNSATSNIYGPGGTRSLEIIEEPLLDGNDADLWFAACSTSMIDTIEVTHLQGEETPVFEQESAFLQDAIKYKVRQTFGVGAIDWRGLYKSTGA